MLSSIVFALLAQKELVVLVCGLCIVACLLFLLVSSMVFVRSLLLFLDIFHTILRILDNSAEQPFVE